MVKLLKKAASVDAILAGDILAKPDGEWSGLPDWVRVAFDEGDIAFRPGIIDVTNIAGERFAATVSDWLVLDAGRDLSVCTDDVFSLVYQLAPEPAEQVAFRAGDVVELISGSFPMTVLEVQERGSHRLHLAWDRNGAHSGKAACFSTTCLPVAACKTFVPYAERPQNDSIPF